MGNPRPTLTSPTRSTALLVLLALLAALVPATAATADDHTSPYEGWVETWPEIVRPGAQVLIDLRAVPHDGVSPLFEPGATVDLLDWDGEGQAGVALEVVDGRHARFVTPALPANDHGGYHVTVRSGDLTAIGWLGVADPDEFGLGVWLEFPQGRVGQTEVPFTASAAWLDTDTHVTHAVRFRGGDAIDETDDTSVTMIDEARGIVTLAAPLAAGDDIELELVSGDVVAEGWVWTGFPDVELRNATLLEGSASGAVLEFEARAFDFDGSEVVRLRSRDVPIPSGALGASQLGDDGVLRVEVQRELGVGSYDLTIDTAIGRFQEWLDVREAGVFLNSRARLVRGTASGFDDGYVSIESAGPAWTDAAVVQLFDRQGQLATTLEDVVRRDFGGGVQRLEGDAAVGELDPGLYQVRVVEGETTATAGVVAVHDPYLSAWTWRQSGTTTIELFAEGFDLPDSGQLPVRIYGRDGGERFAGTVQAYGGRYLEFSTEVAFAPETHRVELDVDGTTYVGRFHGDQWAQLEVTPSQSAAGSRPEEFAVRLPGGDLGDKVLTPTQGLLQDGTYRRAVAEPFERTDPERGTVRYPGGLVDGDWTVTVDDDGIWAFGDTRVGAGGNWPQVRVVPSEVPSTPATLTVETEGFTVEADAELDAQLSVYDWDADENVEIDGVAAVRFVDATTLEVDIDVELEEGSYDLEVSINGAVFRAFFEVREDLEDRWVSASPWTLPSGFEAPTDVRLRLGGFSIGEEDLGDVRLEDDFGDEVVGAIGAVALEDPITVVVELTTSLDDGYYWIVAELAGRTYWAEIMVGDGPPYAFVSPWQILPDEPTTVDVFGVNTTWTADTTVQLFAHAGWGTTDAFVADLDTGDEGEDGSDGDGAASPLEGIEAVRFVSPTHLEVDLAALEEGDYRFAMDDGERVTSAYFSVRVPTSLTVTPSQVRQDTLPQTLTVEAVNVDLQSGMVSVRDPGWNDRSDWFTATGPTTGTIALPADAPRGWYGLFVNDGDRFADANFRVTGDPGISVSPALFTDVSSSGRTLAVTSRNFDLTSPSVTLEDAEGVAVPVTVTPRWWERADVRIDQALTPGGYTLTVTQGEVVVSAPVDVVAAPPPGGTAPPRAGVSSGTAQVTNDPDTGLLTATVGAFEVSDLTISFAIPGCPPGDDIDDVDVWFNDTELQATWDGDTCQGSVTVPAELITGDRGGTLTVEVERDGEVATSPLGEIVLYDPAGFVTDAESGEPIEGATVTLYNAPGLVPATGETTGEGECESSATVTVDPESGRNLWSQLIDPADGIVEPGDSDRLEPRPLTRRADETSKNPLVTTETGYYGWDVAEGCWFVIVEADDYLTQVSPVVGVGAPPLEDVTDLDLQLVPVGDGNGGGDNGGGDPPVDEDPPTWPPEATVTVDGATTTQLSVSWPAASDPSTPVTYQVSVDGTPVSPDTLEATSYVISDLQPATTYLVSVRARDAVGNVGEPIVIQTATADPPDTTPPVWGEGALAASQLTATSLRLTWPAATDDSPPVTYTVRRDGQVLTTTTATTYDVTGLSPATSYGFAVTATDAVGNTTPEARSLTVSTLPATTTPPPTTPAEPVPPRCDEVPPRLFRDVPPDHAHADAIGCGRGLGLFEGRADGSFGPGETFRRDQVASVLVRALEASGLELPVGEVAFGDIDGNVHATAIRKLAATGIVRGRSTTRFDPSADVTRGQLATMLDRAASELLAPLPDVDGPRFDDTGGHTHQQAIDRLHAAEIARGLPGGRLFGPDLRITRGQSASLVVRWLEDQADRLR